LTDPWNNVEKRRARKNRTHAAPSQSEIESESEFAPPPAKPDPFSATVKDAEKSILIHNLNLGQNPTLNPATISSKITAALLLCVAQVDPLALGQVTAGVKDTIDDIMGLVKGMTLFGTGTRPNRNPLKPEDNGKFYTVPVKLTFASKQVAIRVTEVLKGKYKLPITTPYHKSLRACFTHVQKSVRALNPNHQVRVNLDQKNCLLKASVRSGDKSPCVSNSLSISNTFRTNPYCSYECRFNSNSNKRGVGILIKNNSNISILQETRGADDNSLLLKASYQGSVFILASIYGPNRHCPRFFEILQNDLAALGDHPVVMGGDWNCTVSPLPPLSNPDVINMNSIPNKRHSQLLHNLCTDASLIDPFRAKFPNRKEFTYIPSDPIKKNRSRIDFFIISNQLLNSVTDISICPGLQSKVFDHKAVLLSFKPKAPIGPVRPTISHTILRDPDLDLVVALAVADTYLASSTLRNDPAFNHDFNRLLAGVGGGFDSLRRAGPSDVHINPGDRSEAESLTREGIIGNI
jgi:exonuclease III